MQQFTEIDKRQLSVDNVQMVIDVYDDCIAYLDRRFGTLVDELRQRGVLENTLMVLGILEKRWKLLATRNLSSQFWCVSAADSCRHSERPVENPHP